MNRGTGTPPVQQIFFCTGGVPVPQFMPSPFVKLADPASYVACSWELVEDRAGLDYWVDFFSTHIDVILGLGVEAAVARGEAEADALGRAAACRAAYLPFFANVRADPAKYGRVTILTLDEWRDGFLRRHGFDDAFVDLKNRENGRMLPLLPVVCEQLDAMNEAESLRAAVEGVFAGNIFDMGAKATAARFRSESPDFFQTRRLLPGRPWRVDEYDALAAAFLGKTHRKAAFFIDNAGSDFLLGAIPLCRWLARRGTKIVVAANERPSLNDMTAADVRAWWPRILEVEPSLEKLPFQIVSTGTGEPLIDLSAVSDELNEVAADADLVILEGMGRGVESNLNAAFNCDAANMAMLKDEAVAARLGGKVFDVVCRFR